MLDLYKSYGERTITYHKSTFYDFAATDTEATTQDFATANSTVELVVFECTGAGAKNYC